MVQSKLSMDAVSLFSGCGGSDLGLRQAGVEAVWANDKNESQCEFYQAVTGTKGTIHPGDISGIDKFPKQSYW